ncbi:MAG: hypothetical protein BGO99_00025 [Nitrosospira sp. 56-18]|jgi:hypothetical protein|nr:hypothetical protein [Nitrosospira sp.]OJY07703.1 MAG: hypothetical protein BGO99_00025 [Nitrosospira sp. 56-18]
MRTNSLSGLMKSLAVAAIVATYSQVAIAVQPLSYSTSVDNVTGTASFHVKFDSRPDFYTVDHVSRQADSVQFWVDAVARDPIIRAYNVLDGKLTTHSQNVISFHEIPSTNQLQIIWVAPETEPGPRGYGGWGFVAGSVDYSLTADNVLSFEVPLSLLRDTDGVFYYDFATVQYGSGGNVFTGVSGISYDTPVIYAPPIPEPNIFLLMLSGIALLAVPGYRSRYGRLAKEATAVKTTFKA